MPPKKIEVTELVLARQSLFWHNICIIGFLLSRGPIISSLSKVNCFCRGLQNSLITQKDDAQKGCGMQLKGVTLIERILQNEVAT